MPDGGASASLSRNSWELSGRRRRIKDFACRMRPIGPTGRNQEDFMNQHPRDTILRLKQVQEITGLGRSTIYLYVSRGKFPKSRQLGERAVGWMSSEVFLWIASRAQTL